MDVHYITSTIDGTSGGTIPVRSDLPKLQIAASGRATGTLTITGTSKGSDTAEAFQPALTLDLSTERTAMIDNYLLDSITIAVSAAGSDIGITVGQWE